MILFKYILLLSIFFILNACVSTKTSDRYRAMGIEPKQETKVKKQGQFITDIIGIFIEQQTGVSASLILGITNGGTITYINEKFNKIERYREHEHLLREQLLHLKKDLTKLKIQYRALEKSLANMQNLKASKRRELKNLNNQYTNSINNYQRRLIDLEDYVQSSNKILQKKPILKTIREYQYELDSL